MSQILVPEVVTALADANDVDPTELDILLAEYIDLEALDRLAHHEHSTWTLTFELPEHSMTVASDGRILVDGRLENDWSLD